MFISNIHLSNMFLFYSKSIENFYEINMDPLDVSVIKMNLYKNSIGKNK